MLLAMILISVGSGACSANAGDGRGDGGSSTLGEVVDCFWII